MTALLLGALIYGDAYIDTFERFCLPTMLAPQNHRTLHDSGSAVAIFTDGPSRDRLEAIMAGKGLPADIRLMPSELMAIGRYEALAFAHWVWVKKAAQMGMAFHMLCPDQMYSERYFPRLFALAKQHGDIVHNGLNFDLTAAAEDLEAHREADGSIAISGWNLGNIAWRNLHPRMSAYLMNSAAYPDRLPYKHFQLWRAKDRAMLFSPHNSPVWMTPETCERMEFPNGTLDRVGPALIGGDFFAPSINDDMVIVGIERAETPAEVPAVDFNAFGTKCLAEVDSRQDLLTYFERPAMEVALPLDDSAPTAGEIMGWQADLAGMLRGSVRMAA